MTKYTQNLENYIFDFFFPLNIKLFLQIILEKFLHLNILKINMP